MVLRNIVQIGAGKWGQKYISTIQNIPEIKLTVANRNNWKSLLDSNPCGVIVCTPPSSHVEIASYALERSLPTMIEKPLALSVNDANSLKNFSAPILVNHSHLFSQSFQTLKQFTDQNLIEYISVDLFNDGPIREYSALWDYGPHAIAILLALMNKKPNKIDVKKQCQFGPGPIEEGRAQYFLTLAFDQIFTFCTIGNVGARTRKIKVRSNGIDLEYDDVQRPSSNPTPLHNALMVFLELINGETDWRAGLNLSLDVLNILEQCQLICK